jgi:hypothetical protein
MSILPQDLMVSVLTFDSYFYGLKCRPLTQQPDAAEDLGLEDSLLEIVLALSSTKCLQTRTFAT